MIYAGGGSVFGGANDDVLAGNEGVDSCDGTRASTVWSPAARVRGSSTRRSPTTRRRLRPTTRKVVASAIDPDEANGNAATLMPAANAASKSDVQGGNVTAYGDGV